MAVSKIIWFTSQCFQIVTTETVEECSFESANVSNTRVTLRLTNQKPVFWKGKCQKVCWKFSIEIQKCSMEIFFVGKARKFCNEQNKETFKKWRKLNLKVLNEKFSLLKSKQMCTLVYLCLKYSKKIWKFHKHLKKFSWKLVCCKKCELYYKIRFTKKRLQRPRRQLQNLKTLTKISEESCKNDVLEASC